MRSISYQTFAYLCEGFLDEASTSLNLIGNSPGGREVVKTLHSNMGLGHDINYSPVEKISWSELKDAYKGAWVIIIGSKGTGAIKARGSGYEALASTGSEPEHKSDARGGNILDFLKSNIGKLQKFYVAKNTTAVTDKQRKRSELKASDPNEFNQEKLVKKFKPLWVKAINAAIADIKGHVANQIKNDAFDKAKNKLTHIENLQNGLESIEAGNQDVPGFIGNAVNTAILMAASHHYPEQTGNITKGYSRNYSADNPEGPKLLLKDISQGDTAKLGTILSFFKRALISG